MQAAGLPVIPGSGAISSRRELLERAREIGYPLLVKASSGGGGRGMRLVRDEQELLRAFDTARGKRWPCFKTTPFT